MSIALVIRGTKYLPARSLPYVSSNILDAETVIDMVLHADQFCDASNDTVLTPLKYDQGTISIAIKQSFKAVTVGGQLPSGLMFKESSARNMFYLCCEHGINLGDGTQNAVHSWNLNAELSSSQRKHVFEHLPQPRINSKESTRADILAGFKHISKICEGNGFLIDPECLPCTSKVWHKFMAALGCERVSKLSSATFKDHMKALGLRWNIHRQHVRDERLRAFIQDHLSSDQSRRIKTKFI